MWGLEVFGMGCGVCGLGGRMFGVGFGSDWYGVWGLGCRVFGLGFGMFGMGCVVWGLGCRVFGVGFRV